MSHFKLIDLPTFTDERGSLTVLQQILPFDIVRTYWIYGADGQTRGGHRHHRTTQALVAINGIVAIYMNDGFISQRIILDKPNVCLLVEPKDWHYMSFGSRAVLLVLSSQPYDRSDYIEAPYT